MCEVFHRQRPKLQTDSLAIQPVRGVRPSRGAMKPTTFTLFAALTLGLVACAPPSINPSINLQLTPPAPREEVFSVQLRSSASDGPAPLRVVFAAEDLESASYSWFLDDRKLDGERDTLTLTFRNAGTYRVTVAATNAVGETDTDTVEVNVTDVPADEGV